MILGEMIQGEMIQGEMIQGEITQGEIIQPIGSWRAGRRLRTEPRCSRRADFPPA